MERKEKNTKAKTRMIHIRLPQELHKKVRISAAEADSTIQDWVVDVIQDQIQRHDGVNT